MTPRPMKIEAIPFQLLSFKSKGIDIPNTSIGMAYAEIFILRPNTDTNHAVVVVPIFEPKITPIAEATLLIPLIERI